MLIWEPLEVNDLVSRQQEELGHGFVENGVDQTKGVIALVESGVREANQSNSGFGVQINVPFFKLIYHLD